MRYVFWGYKKKLSFPFPTEIVTEGLAEVVVPKLKAFVKKPSDYAPSKAPVFYNPLMDLNRDLAVLALQAFQRRVGRELKVCTPLAGCGIRGIRLALEVCCVGKVIVNDINEKACHMARHNVEKNGLAGKVVALNEDANFVLDCFATSSQRFDYVDVDPFGSPMYYADAALRALRRNGLLAVTATDLAPLCGVHPKACLRKYGGKPLRTEYCHELAVRLLAGALARTAATRDLGVEVLFSHSSDHYIRLYATVDFGGKKADANLQKMGYVNHCFACFHREVATGMFSCREEVCPECGGKMRVSGPLWIGKIINEDFVVSMEEEAQTKISKRKRRVHRLLFLTRKEANASITYYMVDKVCDKLGLPVPQIKKVVAELEKMGHQATLTHFRTHGVKTDAPAAEVKEAIVKLHGIRKDV